VYTRNARSKSTIGRLAKSLPARAEKERIERMKRRLIMCVLALWTSLVFAEDVPLKSDHPEKYTVQKGDTLWDISKMFLDSPWLWPEIWHINQQIENPHLIFPGDVIGLIYLGSRAGLYGVGSGGTDGTGGTNGTNGEGGGPSFSTTRRITIIERGSTGSVIKLSPTARITPIDTAIPPIPLDAINAFLNNTRIVLPSELERAPYVIASADDRLIQGKHGRVYARGFGELAFAEGDWGIFRRGQVFVDPRTEEILGLEAREIGSADLQSYTKISDVGTLLVTSSREEVRMKDRLLKPEDRSLVTTFMPSAPKEQVEGFMIAVDAGVTQVGQYSVVAINLGNDNGIDEGNVLAIYKAGTIAVDQIEEEKVILPDERAGLMMVFKAYQKMSFALVLQTSRPLKVGDKIKNP
jgi:hypothetical protein